jgi:hypothetical protein
VPYLGDIIPLSAQILDSDETKYVWAVLVDPDGNPLPESPVDLEHVGGGKYTSDSVTMPNVSYVECTYEAWDDAAHTIPSDDHLVGTDVFERITPQSVPVYDDYVVAEVDDSDILIAEALDEDYVIAEAEEDDSEALVIDEPVVFAESEDPVLIVEMEDC